MLVRGLSFQGQVTAQCRIRREVWRKVCDGAEEARQPRLCVTH